ncbi:TPA: AAA family ATPase, partial [Enterococcus faecium]|nr:AAA family ATPase [Enterococcus faecium]
MSRNEKKYGIILDNIKIFGEKVSPVVIEFDKGLNLVGGASDTGKTYLYQLVDSLLGKQELPKEIDEAKLYDQATIQISRESSVNTIIRDLKTSNFYYVEGEVIKRVNVKDLTPLSKKHKSDDKKKNGVSNILLDIMGCDYKKIKKNQKGTLVSYSYRNFAHLNMIDEDNIYTSKPYFLAG